MFERDRWPKVRTPFSLAFIARIYNECTSIWWRWVTEPYWQSHWVCGVHAIIAGTGEECFVKSGFWEASIDLWSEWDRRRHHGTVALHQWKTWFIKSIMLQRKEMQLLHNHIAVIKVQIDSATSVVNMKCALYGKEWTKKSKVSTRIVWVTN